MGMKGRERKERGRGEEEGEKGKEGGEEERVRWERREESGERGEGRAGRSGIILTSLSSLPPSLHSLDAPRQQVLALTLRLSSLCQPHPSPSSPTPRLEQVSGGHWCLQLPFHPAQVFSVHQFL